MKKIFQLFAVCLITVCLTFPAYALDKNQEDAVNLLQIEATQAVNLIARITEAISVFEAYGYQAEWTDSDGVVHPAGANPITDEDLTESAFSHLTATDVQRGYQEMKKFLIWVKSGDAPPVLFRLKRK